jgi:hypothetical protein
LLGVARDHDADCEPEEGEQDHEGDEEVHSWWRVVR